MSEYITICCEASKPTGEKCVICEYPLTVEFPEDFPDNFKFCCTCKTIAFAMVNKDLSYLTEWWIRHRIDKVKKVINIV